MFEGFLVCSHRFGKLCFAKYAPLAHARDNGVIGMAVVRANVQMDGGAMI